MARKKSPSSRPSRTPQALELFTNRESERRVASEFFEALAAELPHLAKPVLNFYGVPGIGKTALLAKIHEETSEKWATIRLVHLDVDDQRWTIASTDVGGFFWLMRNALRRCGISTNLFDALYATYYSKQRRPGAGDLHPNPIAELCEDAARVGEVASAASEGLSTVGEVFEALKTVAETTVGAFKLPILAAKLFHNARERYQQRRAVSLHLDFATLTPKEMEDHFPDVLHHDVAEFLLANHAARVAIAIDGFERIQSDTAAEDIQDALQKFCGYMLLHDTPGVKSHCAFLLIGREKLRWDEIYDREWAADLDCHRLGGLVEEDAKTFLKKASAFYDTEGDLDTGQNIRKHAAAILTATRDEDGCHHPYFLFLAVEIVRDRRGDVQRDDLGRTPKELQIRFFRYLNVPPREEQFKALKALALTLGFDEDVYKHLVSTGYISYGNHEFELLVRGRSYIIPDRGRKGYWRFHRFMEQALIDYMLQSPAQKTIAGKVVCAILDYHRTRAHCETLAECTMAHLDHYRMGMEELFFHWRNGLLTLAALNDYFGAYNRIFDFDFAANLRLPFVQQFTVINEEVLGPDHPDTLASLNTLANVLTAKGDYAAAEPLCRRVLRTRFRVLGGDHRDTLASLSDHARALELKGDFQAARSASRRTLKKREQVLGPEHPDTLASLCNLANLLKRKGDFLAAEPLHRRAFEARERVLGPDHPDTLFSLNSLANLLRARGDLAAAETLHRRALESRERVLGPDHPATLASMVNLANLLQQKKGGTASALALWHRALEARERVLGPDHPSTLASLGNLANLLRINHDYPAAEQLYLRVLKTNKRVLGERHPSTLRTLSALLVLLTWMNARRTHLPPETLAAIMETPHVDKHALERLYKLAKLLRTKGDSLTARRLHRHILKSCAATFGPHNYRTFLAVRRVAGMLQDAGDHAATASLYRRVVKNAEKALLKDSRRPKPRFSIYFRKSLKSSVRLMKRSLKDLEPEAHKEKLM